ncbi:MAG: hypothetical protein ACRDTE_20275 [Pseudonocardiaceae bacterium]
MFLDFAEDRAQRRQTTLMTEWVAETDRFLATREACWQVQVASPHP